MAEGTAERTDVSPSELQIEYLDAPLVAAFLDHLEHRLPVRGGASGLEGGWGRATGRLAW